MVGVGLINWRWHAHLREDNTSGSESLIDKTATYITYGDTRHQTLGNFMGGGAYSDLSEQLTLTGRRRSKGGFAEIHQAVWRRNGEEIMVAIKVLRVPHNDQREIAFARKRICREVSIWSQLKHDHILQLYGVAIGLEIIPNEMYGMVCRWAENGDLCHYLSNNDELSLACRLNLLHQVSDALKYLHHNNIVHGDLTGANILVSNEGNILLCDFGLSRIMGDEDNPLYETSSKQKYNIPWSAPEIVFPGDDRGSAQPTTFSDIYSFGSVMLQVLTGHIPFEGRTFSCIVVYLDQHKGMSAHPPRPARPSFVSNELWGIMKRCWKFVPQERLDIEGVCRLLQEYRHAPR